MDNTSLIWLIKRLHNVFEREINARLSSFGLTSAQTDVLRFLYTRSQQGIRVNQHMVEDAFRLKNPTVTGLINRLEEKGFVRRVADPSDGRARLLELTEQEALVRAGIRDTAQAMYARMIDGFGQDEIDQATQLLKKMLENISEGCDRK